MLTFILYGEDILYQDETGEFSYESDSELIRGSLEQFMQERKSYLPFAASLVDYFGDSVEILENTLPILNGSESVIY